MGAEGGARARIIMSTISGTDFIASLPRTAGATREKAILAAVCQGLHCPILWLEVRAEYQGHRATIFVSGDALRIGNASDSIRVNVTAETAQRIADQLGTLLPTGHICDLVWQQAGVRVSPCLQTPDAHMADTDRMVRHSREVDAKVAGRSGLIENVGKHWVLDNILRGTKDSAANYGWFQSNGVPIQPLRDKHNKEHVDYSQVARLVRRDVIVDGQVMDIEQVGTNPALAGLVNTGGLLLVWRQPSVALDPGPIVVDPTPAPPAPAWRVLKIGMKGADVAAWQRVLMKDGYDLSPWNDDGDFGPVTHNATASWQGERNLPRTGIVDEATRNAIGTPPVVRPEPVTPPEAIKFVAARNFTPAARKTVDVVVIHTMEAPEASTTAEAVAAWAAGPQAPQASWHYAIDDDSIVQCVKEEDVAWAAPSRNQTGIQLEHAGYARQTAEQWCDPFSTRMLERSARLVAQICKRWGIPIEFVDAAGLLAGGRGITTHAEVTKGPGKGLTTHTDPGPHFPMTRYLELVRQAFSAPTPA